MKNYWRNGLLVSAFILAGLTVWANDEATLNAARAKRTASLRQVATDRTAIKSTCTKKGNSSACAEAKARYQSDLAVYHSDEAALRTVKGRSGNSSSPTSSAHHSPASVTHTTNVHH